MFSDRPLSELSNDELLQLYEYEKNEEKKKDLIQHAIKILLNSLYGALGNKHFRYCEVENAEAITLFGQVVNKTTQIYINNTMNEIQETPELDNICGGDTDSVYVVAERISKLLFVDGDDIQVKIDKIDQFVKEIIQPEVNAATDGLASMMHSKANKMVWEREVISDAMIYVAKKNYAINVWDNEGVRHYGEPKLKMKGLEAVKSSTPKWSRENLEECYIAALSGSEDKVHENIKGYYNEFVKRPFEEMAQIISVNNIEKYYVNGEFQPKTPKQVKAAVNYNNTIKKYGLEYKGFIPNGEKIKILPLLMPNPTGLPVIGFMDKLPSEFGLEEYIDKGAIFNAAFKVPMKRFLDAIEWSLEKRASLCDYFN